jgi:hypothetical protein
MSSSNSNQSVAIGLAVAAAALVAGYLIMNANNETATGGKSIEDKPSNKSRSGSPDRSRTVKDAAETATPVASNISSKDKDLGSGNSANDKAIHAKIEELDKLGKKLFKEKKVRNEMLYSCLFSYPRLTFI